MPAPVFRHMMPHDIPLFAKFLLTEVGRRYEIWEFDRHFGLGGPYPPGLTPQQIEMVREVTRIRADAVGWIGNTPTIFEVKPEATLAAFGQIMAYGWWFGVETGIDPLKAVITDTTTMDLQALYGAFGITIYLVSPAREVEIEQAVREIALKVRRVP